MTTHLSPTAQGETLQRAAATAHTSAPRLGEYAVMLRDGQGGSLELVLLPGECALLLDVCTLVLHDALPASANMVKVSTADAVYLVSRRITLAGRGALAIGSLYEPSATVEFAYERPEELLALLRDCLAPNTRRPRRVGEHVL
jgi:hypothetical protein